MQRELGRFLSFPRHSCKLHKSRKRRLQTRMAAWIGGETSNGACSLCACRDRIALQKLNERRKATSQDDVCPPATVRNAR